MMNFMNIFVKHILKIYAGFSVMMDFPYELFVLVKRCPYKLTSVSGSVQFCHNAGTAEWPIGTRRHGETVHCFEDSVAAGEL